MESPTILEVHALSKSFAGREAVRSVSFCLERGQTMGLIGPNGAGKSTTVAMLCGLLAADSGTVSINGQTLTIHDHALRKLIGLVPQDLALYDGLSARENLKLFGALYGLHGAALKTRCDAVLELVGLHDRAAEKPTSFSGGMKRRLNIAAALLHQPQLLVLDEPTVGVDPQSRNAIFESLEVLKAQGCSLIYTSHYMEEVERLADQVVIIDHGRVIANEPPALLYRHLPSRASLQIDLAQTVPESLCAALQQLRGVASASAKENRLHITLTDVADGLAVLTWLAAQGLTALHYATEKARLEDVFLHLTGRGLRDEGTPTA